MRPLRILLVTNNYTPYTGGLVSSLKSQVSLLHAQGHHAFLVTFAFLKDHSQDANWIIRIPVLYQFHYKNNYMVIPIFIKQRLIEVYKKIEPDLVHIHHPFLLGSAALSIAQQLNIPTCFTYHTLYEKYLHYVPLPPLITKPITHWMVKNILQHASHIIAPSHGVAALIQPQTDRPISIVPSALQSHFVHRTFTKQKRYIDHPFKLLIVSRLVVEKNIFFALDAFSYLYHDIRFYITIIGFGHLYETLQIYAYQIKQFNPERVIFIHHPSVQTIARHYAISDLFLFTSQSDTQALVLAESLSAGTPVVTVHGMGQHDSITHTKNGFYAHSPAHMAYYCSYLADNPDVHYTMSQHAFVSGRTFLPEYIADKLEAIFQSLVLTP